MNILIIHAHREPNSFNPWAFPRINGALTRRARQLYHAYTHTA